MKNINWIVRIKNKAFWVALIPAVLLLIQVVAAVFGYTLDLGDLGNKLLDVVNAVFAVLVFPNFSAISNGSFVFQFFRIPCANLIISSDCIYFYPLFLNVFIFITHKL